MGRLAPLDVIIERVSCIHQDDCFGCIKSEYRHRAAMPGRRRARNQPRYVIRKRRSQNGPPWQKSNAISWPGEVELGRSRLTLTADATGVADVASVAGVERSEPPEFR